MSLLRSLGYRPFALLWAGQTLSRLGDSIFAIALAWWVLQQTGSAAAMGAVLIFTNLPRLLFLLVGGAVVDRVPRLTVMLASDVVAGLAVSTAALLAAGGALALWHLYLLGALFGLAEAFFAPAYTAVIPELLPQERVSNANSLRTISRRLAGIAGPALGGLIVAAGGIWLAFALDGLSFFAAAACVMATGVPLAVPAQASEEPPRSGIFSEIVAGFRLVLATPWLWVTIVVAAGSTLFLAGPQQAVLPLLVAQHLHGNVDVFALLNAMEAAGALLAAVWLSRYARLHHRGWLVYLPWLAIGLATALMGLSASIPLAVAAMLAIGACSSTLLIAWVHTLQESVARESLGRVASIDVLVSDALVPVGLGLAGVAADRIGAAPVFVAGGLIGAAIIAGGLLHPAVRGMD